MELFNNLLAEIEGIPAVDVHTRIRTSSPAAANLAELALYNGIASELETVGVDPRVFENESAKKRLTDAAPGFPRIKNTATCWRLTQILGDLYDAGPIHESDIDALWPKVEQSASDPAWAGSVLDKANVARAHVACDWRKSLPRASERFVPILRLDSLLNEAHMSRTLDSMEEVTGQTVYEVADMKKAVIALFGKAKEAGAVAASVSFEPQIDFDEGSRDSADRILSLVLLGQKTNREDRKTIRSYAMDLVLKSCAEHEMPIQIMLGTKRPRSSDRLISAYEPSCVPMYVELFARHLDVRFDIYAAHDTIHHELAAVSRSLRNVYLSGSWSHLGFPSHIRKSIRERVEMLPMTKCCALASDAQSVEWVYGHTKLIRRELAVALAGLVREGYLMEEAAVEVASQYLAGNAKRMYGV